MKTPDDTTIQQYLKAVERETSGLPPVRRQEPLADLAEHIDVALAERPLEVPPHDPVRTRRPPHHRRHRAQRDGHGPPPHAAWTGHSGAPAGRLHPGPGPGPAEPSPRAGRRRPAHHRTCAAVPAVLVGGMTRHKAVGTLAVHLVPYGLIKLIQATLPWTSTAMLVTNTVIALLYLGGCAWLWHTRHRTDLVMR